MPCPLVIGMNPSPDFPATSWHPEAKSTRILAEVALGDPDMTWHLDRGLELDNLNPAPPTTTGRMFVDVEVARARLDAWAEEGRLPGRILVLLGEEVADVFTSWAGIEKVPRDGTVHQRASRRLAGAALRLVRIPHPARLVRLRRGRAGDLARTDACFRSIARLYAEGEAGAQGERLADDRRLIEADQRVLERLFALEEDEILRMEEEAEAREIRREALREARRDSGCRGEAPDDLED